MLSSIGEDLQFLALHTAAYLGSLRSRKIEIDGQNYSYLEGGQGPLVLFLHNAAGSKAHWRTLMHIMSNDYRVISVDIPGYSIRNIECRKYRKIRELSEWLDKFISETQSKSAHIVAACSVSMLAIDFANRYPSRVLSISALGLPNLQKRDHFRSLTAELAIQSVEDVDRVLSMLFYRAPSTPTLVKKFYANQARHYSNEIEDRIISLLNIMPIAASRITSLFCPLNLISGSHDIYSDKDFLMRMAEQAPRCQFKVIEKCGHLPYIEKPKEVASILSEFFSNIENPNTVPDFK